MFKTERFKKIRLKFFNHDYLQINNYELFVVKKL